METKPLEIIISPDRIPVLSKTSAETFHARMRTMIYDSGYGLFEYMEVIQFFVKLNEIIRGKDGNEGDKEFLDYVRSEIEKHPKGKFLSDRGVKFETAETGTRYDFAACGDPELNEMEEQLAKLKAQIEGRKEFLKHVPAEGQDIITRNGEAVHITRPVKTSKSSFKITLAK